jgi:HK97 family phage major capsid protein/HK97 family phage prohead protease
MNSKTSTIETGVLFRKAALAAVPSKADDRLITCSISSDAPYERWFGKEILSHRPGSMNLQRVEAGACPFLADHDQTKLIGKVMSVSLDGRKATALIKLGNSALAEEIYADLKAGIRTEISIGYVIEEMEEKEEGNFLVTRFTLLEVSSVSVPADYSIGVNRSENNNHKTVVKNHMVKTMENQNSCELNKGQVLDILALGKMHGFEKEAHRAVEENTSVDAFRQIVLAKLESKTVVVNQRDMYTYDGNQRATDVPKSSLVAAILAQIPGQNSREAGEAIELSQELARSAGRKPRGIFVPIGGISQRALLTSGSAGQTVATDFMGGSFIDMLRNAALITRLGATWLPGAIGNIAIPRQTGSAVAEWLAENGALTATDQSFDQASLAPKTVGARTSLSRQTLLQSGVDIENIVKRDLASCLGLALDMAAIYGTGLNNQPLGILNTSGIGAVVGGANGLAPTWEHIVALHSELANSNALLGSLGFLTNSKVTGKLMTTEKATGTAKFIVENLPDAQGMTKIGGATCGVSNQVPSDLTKGTSAGVCSALSYGNWADLIIAQWGVLDIIVDPFTDSIRGQLNITAFLSADVTVRRPESFAAMKDALTA